MGMENIPELNNDEEKGEENLINSIKKVDENIPNEPSSEADKENESSMSALEQLMHVASTEVTSRARDWIRGLKEENQKKLQVAFFAVASVVSLTLAGCNSESDHHQEVSQQTSKHVDEAQAKSPRGQELVHEQRHEKAFRGYEVSKAGAEDFLTQQFGAERREGGVYLVKTLSQSVVSLSSDQYGRLVSYAEDGLAHYASRDAQSGLGTGTLFGLFRKRVDLTLSQIFEIQNGTRNKIDEGNIYQIKTEGGQIVSPQSEDQAMSPQQEGHLNPPATTGSTSVNPPATTDGGGGSPAASGGGSGSPSTTGGGSGSPSTTGGGSGSPADSSVGSADISIRFENPFAGGDSIIDFIEVILNKVILPLGVTLVIIMIIYTGFRFVVAQGNPTEITQAKKMFVSTIIGAAILLGAWTIANVIRSTVCELRAPGTDLPGLDCK